MKNFKRLSVSTSSLSLNFTIADSGIMMKFEAIDGQKETFKKKLKLTNIIIRPINNVHFKQIIFLSNYASCSVSKSVDLVDPDNKNNSAFVIWK